MRLTASLLPGFGTMSSWTVTIESGGDVRALWDSPFRRPTKRERKPRRKPIDPDLAARIEELLRRLAFEDLGRQEFRIIADDVPALALVIELDDATRSLTVPLAESLWSPYPESVQAAMRELVELLTGLAEARRGT